MDHSDHDHSGGSTNSFSPANKAIARGYWYAIAGVMGTLLSLQMINRLQARHRLRKCCTESVKFPSKPTNTLQQSWATATAISREMSYPQLHIPSKSFSWLTPPPLGRILILCVYWAVIIAMMVNGAVEHDVMFWGRIGYRNAWVTITQLPLLYVLASKSNVLALLAGSSHERLNWMHRWVARTVFVTASVHGWHFFDQWVRADFVDFQMRMMPMTKYGLGAWGVMLWMNVSSLAPVRRMVYELFVAQHIVAACILLWLVYVHVPTDARWLVWWSIAALCFDRAVRLGLFMWQNVRWKVNKPTCRGKQRVGNQAQLTAVGNAVTVVTIKDAHFSWRAGQHIYLWIPKIGPLETHPYTIACAHEVGDGCCCNSIQFVIRAHGGFSKKIHDYATRNRVSQDDGSSAKVAAFLWGPYGAPPRWEMFETLVLISASTGASFTLPILESVLQANGPICTKRVDFVLATREEPDVDFYVKRLNDAVEKAKNTGVELRVHVRVTGGGVSPIVAEKATKGGFCDGNQSSTTTVTGNSLDITQAEGPEGRQQQQGSSSDAELSSSSGSLKATKRRGRKPPQMEIGVRILPSRPDIEDFIRDPVEEAGGETAVIVCGGVSLVSTVRNCVSRLSDERAVHKGTGAQGIYLHVEEYSF